MSHKNKAHQDQSKTILLMGMPNVGKSAIFNRYTGMDVMVSNYSGTTVEYTEGIMDVEGTLFTLKDVPGVYDIEKSVDEAEQVAINMLNDNPDGIIFVMDAMNLESSLHLLMQVLTYNIPTVVALNRSDLSENKGMRIDHRVIASRLNVTVVPTVALGGETLDVLKSTLNDVMDQPPKHNVQVSGEARWKDVERIVKFAVKQEVRAENVTDRFAFLVKPWPGLPIALGVLALMFSLVIGLGMGLRQFVLLPLFNGWLFPIIESAVMQMFDSQMIQNILIGDYGFLIKGIEWPFALVLPYVVSFFITISILEDSGYLPRLAVLLDGIFRHIGLSGSSIIPILLGYGCGIPAIMSSRSLPSRKMRITVAVMVSLAVPCVAQSGAFIALLAERSILALLGVFFISVLAMIGVGFALDKIQKQAIPFTLMELPQLLPPQPKILSKKILTRVRHYIKDGAVPMIIAIFFTSFLYEFGMLAFLGQAFAPVVSGWLNMPEEAATPLIIGIVRRELTVLPLIEMNLTTLQFFTGAVVALFYVPCVAMIATLAKEFSIKMAIGVFIFTTAFAFFIGGLIAQFGGLFIG